MASGHHQPWLHHLSDGRQHHPAPGAGRHGAARGSDSREHPFPRVRWSGQESSPADRPGTSGSTVEVLHPGLALIGFLEHLGTQRTFVLVAREGRLVGRAQGSIQRIGEEVFPFVAPQRPALAHLTA